MTYDDWKTRDDSPEPDPNRCEACGHPEGHCDCPCCIEDGPDPDRENDARDDDRDGDRDFDTVPNGE